MSKPWGAESFAREGMESPAHALTRTLPPPTISGYIQCDDRMRTFITIIRPTVSYPPVEGDPYFMTGQQLQDKAAGYGWSWGPVPLPTPEAILWTCDGVAFAVAQPPAAEQYVGDGEQQITWYTTHGYIFPPYQKWYYRIDRTMGAVGGTAIYTKLGGGVDGTYSLLSAANFTEDYYPPPEVTIAHYEGIPNWWPYNTL